MRGRVFKIGNNTRFSWLLFGSRLHKKIGSAEVTADVGILVAVSSGFHIGFGHQIISNSSCKVMNCWCRCNF